MAGFQRVPNTWEIRVHSEQGSGSRFDNIWHMLFSAYVAPTQMTTDSVGELFETAVSGLLVDQRTDYEWKTLTITDLDSATGPQFVTNLDGLVGSDSNDPLPPNVCGMIEWNTALRGRSFRGRSFISGFCEDGSTGVPTAGVISHLGVFATAWMTALHSAGPPAQDLAVVSRFSGKMDNPNTSSNLKMVPKPRNPAIATAVTGMSVETVWKSQRRRAIQG